MPCSLEQSDFCHLPLVCSWPLRCCRNGKWRRGSAGSSGRAPSKNTVDTVETKVLCPSRQRTQQAAQQAVKQAGFA